MRITTKLAEYVRGRMKELKFSTYDVARESGNKISNGSVFNIYSQRVKDIKDETLEALAKGLKISSKNLRQHAGNETQHIFNHNEIIRILEDADGLSEKDIKEMQHIWDMVRVEILRRKNPK